MHGGAAGSGAPIGNRNAWQHGEYGGTAKVQRQAARVLLAYLRRA